MENGFDCDHHRSKVAGKRVFNMLQQIRYRRADKEFTESDEKMSEREERRNSKERHKQSGIDLLAGK